MDTEPKIRTTQAQIQYYLKFCKEHPEINNRFDKSDKVALGRIESLWIQLAEHLNNITGPSKSAKKWQESLSHRKVQVRSRLRKLGKKELKKKMVCINNVGIKNPIETSDETAELDGYEVKMEFEEPTLTTEQLSEYNEPQSEVVLNASQSENEYPFDTLCYKRDDEHNNDSTTSQLSTPYQNSATSSSHINFKNTGTKSSKTSKDVNLAAVCSTIIKSLEARKEREEVLFIQQQCLMRKLDHSLTLMTAVLEKIDAKLLTK
ncbi:unnamed protein product [Ceratitis capitata]|uniref:(Mediterranean fruit fly) hypothetical protein n=1 Tax=Ceratitis capitata TaxID=7213 RepID=A0A811UAB9_CERCA|nr:unnamed protein product [Ceratitis capitata]